MLQSADRWREKNTERVLANLRARIETAKLLSGITLAVASTLVATALQVGAQANSWDWAAALALLATFAATIAVVGWDRWMEPEGEAAERLANEERLEVHELKSLLALEDLLALRANRAASEAVRRAMFGQIGFSLLASVLAAISLLRP